jgi:DNA-binding NarL/FixJ family response regulator
MSTERSRSDDPCPAPAVAGVVAVVDSVPIYRRGLVALCAAAGLQAVEAVSLDELQGNSELVGVVIVLRLESDWELLARLQEAGPPVLLAVVLSFDPPTIQRALLGGARGIIDWSADPCELTTALRQAVEGKTILPNELWRELLTDAVEPTGISQAELSWLRDFAAGLTVSSVADKAGYSERELYRHLASLYRRLRVAGRTEALLWAQQAGLLAARG